MKISKKKQEEFNKILFFRNDNNIFLDINLFRDKLINSDFYEIFLNYTKKKFEEMVKKENFDYFHLHLNINSLIISDLCHYENIYIFIELLNEFGDKLSNIYVYGNSNIFTTLISMINKSLNINIHKRLIFKNDDEMIAI